MDYSEFTPSPALAHLVDRIWILTGPGVDPSSTAQPVMPDGRPELVMHFGEPFERVSVAGVALRQAVTIFAGQLTAQLTLRPTGRVAVLGVRFHPHGASALLAVPQGELTGLTLGIDDISTRLSRALQSVRDRTDDVHAAIPLVQRVLERWVNGRSVDVRLDAATNAILEVDGVIAINDVAGRVGLSRRHLERLFLEGVGIPPKRLACIARFQKALRMLDEVDVRGRGTRTAAECGYADQAHFIREFRQLAGSSPSEHLLRKGEMTGFFYRGPS